MPVSSEDFLTAFPEFGNAADFPLSQIAFWLDTANDMLPAALFGKRLTLAVLLYTAHHLVLSSQAAKAAAGGGGGVGAVTGPVTLKTVGSVSKAMNASLTAFQGAGPWNGSSYGQRYFQIIRGLATGPFYRPSARAAQIRAAEGVDPIIR